MRYADFEGMVRRLGSEVPTEFLEGIAGIEVSPRTLYHPEREEIYTLGECIPIPGAGPSGPKAIQSRVVLYYGSFVALARDSEEFDWQAEAWETLTHELRHHLEWRAGRPELEEYDDAAEGNFARGDGEPFDPEFHLAAEAVSPGVYRLDDDFFVDQVHREVPAEVRFHWRRRDYRVTTPPGLTLPAFLSVEGVAEPPAGELVVVLRAEGGWRALFRRQSPVWQGTVRACPATP